MKHQLAKSVALSLLSPVIVGSLLGIYYSITLQGEFVSIFFSLLMTAISNAHIVGLTMAAFVVPGYLLMFKYSKQDMKAILKSINMEGLLIRITLKVLKIINPIEINSVQFNLSFNEKVILSLKENIKDINNNIPLIGSAEGRKKTPRRNILLPK